MTCSTSLGQGHKEHNYLCFLVAIDVARILFNHSIAVVLWGECLNRPLHHSDPLTRKSIVVALVEKLHDCRFERAIKRLSVERVHLGDRNVVAAVTNRKAVHSIVTLEPPAIEYRKIEPAIDRDFLATRARSFEWTTRHVQPNVNRLD